MTDYLANLVRRSFGYVPPVAVKPVYTPCFPPVSGAVNSARLMMESTRLDELAHDTRQSGSIAALFEKATPRTAGLTPPKTGFDEEDTIISGKSRHDRKAETSTMVHDLVGEKYQTEVVNDEITTVKEPEFNKLPEPIKDDIAPQRMESLEEDVRSKFLVRENKRGIAENKIPLEDLISARVTSSVVQPEPRVRKDVSEPQISSDLSKSAQNALFDVENNVTYQRGKTERSLSYDPSPSVRETIPNVRNVRDLPVRSISQGSSKPALKKSYPQPQRSRIASVKEEDSQFIGMPSGKDIVSSETAMDPSGKEMVSFETAMDPSGKSEQMMSAQKISESESYSKVETQPAIVEDILRNLPLIRPVSSLESSSSMLESKKSKPAPVHVHIGTIEVRAAPLPQPAALPAPKPEGFGKYQHLRNYATWEL